MDSWRKDIGRQSPSSGTEVIYGSPEEELEEEWYDESMAPTTPLGLSPAQLSVTPATAARPPAQVSPPVKFPVPDERLRISSSKVRPVVSVLHDVPNHCQLTLLWLSLRAHLGVVITRP